MEDFSELSDFVAFANKADMMGDLFHFNQVILDNNILHEQPHRLMCDSVQYGGDRQLHLWPRGHLKSTVITIGYTLYLLSQNPNLRIFIGNSVLSNAKSFLREIKGHLKDNEKLRAIMGDVVNKDDKWTETEIILKTRTINRKEPSIQIAGVGQSLVSQHYDVMFLDDLVDRDNINTPELIQKTIDWYKLALSLLEPDGKLIIIGTRWHYADLYGYLIENAADRFKIQTHSCYDELGNPIYPTRFSKEWLEDIKKDQGSFLFSCNPYEAPVLMSDWTTKPIGEVKEGDEVVGFTIGNERKHRSLTKTKVLEVRSRKSQVQKVYLESGRIIRCTPDHEWFTGRQDKTHKLYAPAHIGGKLLEVVNTDINCDDMISYAYLGGMIDGEGSCKHGSIFISQCPIQNPEVHKRIREVLDKLNIGYNSRGDDDYVWLNGGRQTKFDIIRYSDLAKKTQILDVLYKRCGTVARRKDRVVNIEPDGEETVYSMQTETGNYVVWGYASKNCNYLNDPVDEDSAKFKRSDFQYFTDETLQGKELYTVYTIDRAYSLSKTADYTAHVVVSIDRDNNWYVRLAKRTKETETDLIKRMFETKQAFNVDKVGVEQKAFKDTLEPTVREEMNRRGIFFQIEELKGRNSKITRIESLVPRFENHKIYLRKGMEDLEDELIRFPLAKHDDLSDGLAYINDLAQKPNAKIVKRQKIYSQFTGRVIGYK